MGLMNNWHANNWNGKDRKKAEMEDHGPLVLKLGNNHVIFQILLLPMEIVRSQNTCIFWWVLFWSSLLSCSIIYFGGVEILSDVVYNKSEEQKCNPKKIGNMFEGIICDDQLY